MADSPLRRALTGFPAVQEPRDISRAQQTTIVNIRERLRQIEEQVNLLIGGGNAITATPFPEAPADGNIYGRRNRAWTIIKTNGLRFTFSEDAPDLASGTPGDEWLESDRGILYTLVDDGSQRQWVELAGVGQGPDGTGYLQVDIYDTPGSYTWTKPSGATYVEAAVAGGGGGGGNGGMFYTYRARGGSGGGGGALVQFGAPAASFGATESVVVAAGGLGGNGWTGSFPLYLGNNGAAGGNSSFAGIIAYGGGGGTGGTNAADWGGGGAGAAGAGGTATGVLGAMGGVSGGLDAIGGFNTHAIGGAGGSGPSSDAPGWGGAYALNGGCSGASGGPGNEYGTYFAGGDAYEWGAFDNRTVLGGTTNLAPARNGGSASGLAPSLRGAGGAGGAGGSGTTAGNGGAGQQPSGGGGGGGGAGGSGGGPGAGGNGGDGIVIVITYF